MQWPHYWFDSEIIALTLGTKILRVLFWNYDVSNHDHCCLLKRDAVWSGRSIPDFQRKMLIHHSCTVMMRDVGYSEKTVKFYTFTWLHIPQHESCRDDFLKHRDPFAFKIKLLWRSGPYFLFCVNIKCSDVTTQLSCLETNSYLLFVPPGSTCKKTDIVRTMWH